MITLAHISDLHLSPMPQVTPKDLVGKRLTGFLNWKLKRHGEMNTETLSRLVAHMQDQNADFTAVTGDLTNLALRAEVRRAGKWSLQCSIPKSNVRVMSKNSEVGNGPTALLSGG